jgi:hypothetical protein
VKGTRLNMDIACAYHCRVQLISKEALFYSSFPHLHDNDNVSSLSKSDLREGQALLTS